MVLGEQRGEIKITRKGHYISWDLQKFLTLGFLYDVNSNSNVTAQSNYNEGQNRVYFQILNSKRWYF